MAAQQGKYLGRMFRTGGEALIGDVDAPHFNFHNKGVMAYVGDSNAAVQVQPAGILMLGEGKVSNYAFYRSLYGEEETIKVLGWNGFALWRYTYFSSMFASRSQWAVGMDWARAALFGRAAASSTQGTLLHA